MTGQTHYTPQEIARLGQDLYERELRSRIGPNNHGRFLVIDVLTGDYEVDDDDLVASDRILSRKPEAMLYGLRVGYAAAYRLGASRGMD